MSRTWPLMALVAGGLLLGVTGIASAHESEHCRDRSRSFYGYRDVRQYEGGRYYQYDRYAPYAYEDRHDREHYRLERAHENLHDELDEAHERWHERHPYASERAHERLHERLERAHDRAHDRLDNSHDRWHDRHDD